MNGRVFDLRVLAPGAAVLAWAVLAAMVAGTAVSWPLGVIVGLLAGVVAAAVAAGPKPGPAGLAGRIAAAAVIGCVVGELATMVVFAGALDRVLDEQAARSAASAPAVLTAGAELDRARTARAGIDDAVAAAAARRDQALVVARCEFNPSPACPQTRITGVPGAGPQTRTANQLLADSQRELDRALADRDRMAPTLDGELTAAQNALAAAHSSALAGADRGFGARWVAMNDYTLGSPAALVLRAGLGVGATLLGLLALALRTWGGDAVAAKRAQVREAAEMLWAEQRLTSAQLAVAAQNEIDAAQQRHRVAEVLEPRTQAPAPEPETEPEPGPGHWATPQPGPAPKNLPARAERTTGLLPASIPFVPEVTRVAARWIRPLVPPVVVKALDTTTAPVRAVIHAVEEVIEEVEEIQLTLRRSRKVTVSARESRMSVEIPSVAIDYDPDAQPPAAPQGELSPVAGDAELGAPAPRRQLPPAR